MTTSLTEGLSTLWNNWTFIGIGSELLLIIIMLIFVFGFKGLMRDKLLIGLLIYISFGVTGIISFGIFNALIIITLSIWIVILSIKED